MSDATIHTGRSVRTAFGQMLPRTLLIRRLDRRATKSVLLTFDDGPHPAVTPAVLDRLDAYGARAVFFIIGRRIEMAAHLLKEITQRGHLLGNHSYLHLAEYVLPTHPKPHFLDYYRDCQRCQTEIERHTGIAPQLFRAPGGRISSTTLLVPKLLGLRFVKWSLDVKDWQLRTATEAIARAEELLRTIAPRDIVLLHDDNPYVLQVLDILLPALRSREIDLCCGVDLL